MIVNKIKAIKPKVLELLESLPHLRDNDAKLIANIWLSELGKHNSTNVSAFEFLSHLAGGNITSSDIITRTRRKIQEERPDLQGQKRKQRKQLEKETRQNINL